MSDPLYAIAMAASEVKVRAPEDFDKLVESFRQFEGKCIDNLLAADGSGIMGAQAKANVVRELRTKLETCFQIRGTR